MSSLRQDTTFNRLDTPKPTVRLLGLGSSPAA
ncbi:unnamed protein product [Protopolystoma xenopodis]|uniref:Uncharacterized protein n=1 Tax=Protopolystoma xenopodis TaxID=117903 RepID=A0A448X539_9PLAT|nr:unnamed protein product [Protopolystoma xenopodis]